jgi:hypothetical protein
LVIEYSGKKTGKNYKKKHKRLEKEREGGGEKREGENNKGIHEVASKHGKGDIVKRGRKCKKYAKKHTQKIMRGNKNKGKKVK